MKNQNQKLSRLWKLTRLSGYTRGGTLWGAGVTHREPGNPVGLCREGWLHAYESPWQAHFFREDHGYGQYIGALWWEARGKVGLRDSDKCGCTELTTLRRVRAYRLTPRQEKVVAIRLALKAHIAKGYKNTLRKLLHQRALPRLLPAPPEWMWSKAPCDLVGILLSGRGYRVTVKDLHHICEQVKKGS